MTVQMIVQTTTDGDETTNSWSQVIILFSISGVCLWNSVRSENYIRLYQTLLGCFYFCDVEPWVISCVWNLGYFMSGPPYDFWAVCQLNHVYLVLLSWDRSLVLFSQRGLCELRWMIFVFTKMSSLPTLWYVSYTIWEIYDSPALNLLALFPNE